MIRALPGARGERASAASDDPTTRVTRARYRKSTNCGRSPICLPFSTRTSWCWWSKFSTGSVKRTPAQPCCRNEIWSPPRKNRSRRQTSLTVMSVALFCPVSLT